MRHSSSPSTEAMPRTDFHSEFNSLLSDLHSQASERLPLSSDICQDRLHPRSPSSSPLTKRTKLHRDRQSRKLAGNLSNQYGVTLSSHRGEYSENSRVNTPHQRAELRECVPAEDAHTPSTSDSKDSSKFGSEMKSGNLVLVSWPRGPLDRSRSRSYPSDSRTPPRCPSIVQVCRRYPEHWAVIRRTKHRLTEKPQFLSLKRCRVTRTRACQFTVHLDGAEGRAFTFEASSPELADEWVRAFTPAVSPSSELYSHPRLRKPIDNVLNSVILEEEEEDMSIASPSEIVSQPRTPFGNVSNIILEEECDDSFEEAFIPDSTDSSDIASRLTHKQESICPATQDMCDLKNISEASMKLTWRDAVLRDNAMSRSRSTSLPVLYEEEEGVELEP